MYTITLNINTDDKIKAEAFLENCLDSANRSGLDVISCVVHEEMTMEEKMKTVLAMLAEFNEVVQERLDTVTNTS